MDEIKVNILEKIKEKVFSPPQEGKSKIYSLEFPAGHIDPLSWLQVQSLHPKMYWCDRKQNFELAGIGQTDLIKSGPETDIPPLFKAIRDSLSGAGQLLRYFGGMSFNTNERNDLCWKSFGNFYFVLPQFEIVRQRGRTSFITHFQLRDQNDWTRKQKTIPNALEQISFQPAENDEPIPGLVNCQYNPDQGQWQNMIENALNEIDLGHFEKIVLARQSRFEFVAALNVFTLLRKLKQLDPDNIYFYLQPEPEICFVSSTPEILYARQGRNISSEAVAATRLRGRDEKEDKKLERELLTSDKDLREHRLVVKSMHDTLKPLCRNIIQPGKIKVLKQARIQHLYAQFKGVLKPNIQDETIVCNLHPTPAVGGFPTRPALNCLKMMEPFGRGWYAAPVGWISDRAAKFAVAIRSGLICKNQLLLYSGAGIVKGSQAEAEWNETSNKIAGYLKILGIQDNLYFDHI
jgi:menaquinone-specific isochorismate synthase